MKALAGLVALGLLAATAAVAAPLSAEDRQAAFEFGGCAYYTRLFMDSVKADGGTEADRALIQRSTDSLSALAKLFDATRPPVPREEFDKIRDEIYAKTEPRLAPLEDRADAAAAIRDEFRGDLETCIARANALVAGAGPTPGGTKP